MNRRGMLGAFLIPLAAAALGLKPATAAPPVAVPLVWTDLAGRDYGPVQLKGAAATVFVFFSTQCPVSETDMPRVRALAQRYFSRRVSFFLVNANPLDSAARIRAYAEQRHLLMPLVKDGETALADRLGATATPEAVVVDRTGAIRYRGRIDDSQDPAFIHHHDLQAALEAVLAGRPVATPRTAPVGCYIVHLKPHAPAGGAAVTYARDVAPILNRQCVSCHHPGAIAPFSLATYREARVWARQIKSVTQQQIMPPWKPVPGYGDFEDAQVLTARERTLLARWADEGAAEGMAAAGWQGDPVFRQGEREEAKGAKNAKWGGGGHAGSSAPLPFASFAPFASSRSLRKTEGPEAGWTLEEPDLILHARQPFHVRAEGRDEYRDFILPVDFTQDTYVSLTQLRPDQRAVVHHVIVFIDPKAETVKLAGSDPNASFDNPHAGAGSPVPDLPWLAGWAPGNTPRPAPAGTAVRIPKGAKLVMEVHYHPSGEALIDQTEIGLTFARRPVQKQLLVRALAQPVLPLEPNCAHIPVIASETLTEGETVYAISPHMHRIGKEIQVWATLPDGHRIPLIWLKNWDFNWQETYHYRHPIHLPKDTKIELVAYYDNTASNPRNPNQPPKRITWGEQTTDEMCIAFFLVTLDAEQLNAQPAPPGSTVRLPAVSQVAAAPVAPSSATSKR